MLDVLLPCCRYQTKIDALSELMKLRRHHPMDDAVWLLEFVAKTGGANHLKLGSRNLDALQYFSLDVVAFVLLALWVGCKVIAKIFLFGRRRRSSQKRKAD